MPSTDRLLVRRTEERVMSADVISVREHRLKGADHRAAIGKGG
jgi:hypothetical protein